MINFTGFNQIPSQSQSAKKLHRTIQTCLTFLHGGLRLAPVKPVGLKLLRSTGMTVRFYR